MAAGPIVSAVGNLRRPGGTLALALGATIVAGLGTLLVLRFASTHPDALPAILIGAALAAALVIQPRWAVPAFVALVWASIGRQALGGLPSPVEVGAVALLAVGIWLALSERKPVREVLALCALLGLAGVASSLLAPSGPSIDVDGLKNLVFLFAVAMCVRSLADGDRVAIALALIGIILGLGAAYSVLVGPTEIFKLNLVEPNDLAAPRAAGPFGEANFFALSLATLVPFVLYLATRGGARTALAILAAPALAAGLLATGSRGGLLAACFALLAAALFGGSNRLRIAVVASLACIAALLPVFALQAGDSAGRTLEGRAAENLVAVAMFADHPLSGVGTGRFPENYRDYSRQVGNDDRYLREPHSLPLEIAAEQGAAGLIAWAAGIAIVVGYIRRRRLWDEPLGRAVILALGTFALGSLFLHGSQLRLLMVLIGLAFALGRFAPGNKEEPGR